MVQSLDSRVEYISSIVQTHLQAADKSTLTTNGNTASQLSTNKAVQRFIDDSQCTLLVISHDAHQLVCQNHVNEGDSSKLAVENKENVDINSNNEIYLVKRTATTLSTDSSTLASQLLITTTPNGKQGEALQQLQLLLTQVYEPKLKSNNNNNAPLQLPLTVFHTALQKAIQQYKSTHGSEDDVSDVHSVDQEISYWQRNNKDTDRSTTFISTLKRLLQCTTTIQQMTTISREALIYQLEDIQEVLIELYEADIEPMYQQARMRNLLSIVSTVLITTIQRQLSALDLWYRSTYTTVSQQLQSSIDVLTEWSSITQQLTQQEWKSTRRWTGDAYQHPALVTLTTRLQSILQIRTVMDQLGKMFTRDEAERLGIPRLSALLGSSVDVLQITPTATQQWEHTLSQFDRLMVPIEAAVASMLRSRMQSLIDRPQLLQRELRTFSQLLQRRSVQHALDGEKRSIATQLLQQLKQIEDEFHLQQKQQPTTRSTTQQRNSSHMIELIVQAHQLVARIDQITELVNKSFHAGGDERTQYDARATKLMYSIETAATEHFQQWQEDKLSAARSGDTDVILNTNGKLMELDQKSGGRLRVLYSEAIVTLMREARQLQELGYKIDPTVLSAVDLAERYYRSASKLEQIARFYNSQADEILPCQLQLMLMEAQKFESVVRRSEKVRWNDEHASQQYVVELEQHSRSLAERNRRLRATHQSIIKSMEKLSSYDLLRHRDRLMQGIEHLRAAVAVEEKKGNTAAAMRVWQRHLDQQLYKILLLQYRSACQSLSSSDSQITQLEMQVDLVYDSEQRALTFKPTLHELRSKYFLKIREVLDLPNNFIGFLPADTNNNQCNKLFTTIPQVCAEEITEIYKQFDTIYTQLQALPLQYDQWIVVAASDSQQIESTIQATLQSIADYEYNFTAIKERRKDASKNLVDSMKVGCVTVNLQPLKSTIDEQAYHLTDLLMRSLKMSTEDSRKRIDEFMTQAMKRLSTVPKTVEEMLDAQHAQSEVLKEGTDIEALLSDLQAKDRLLRQHASRAIMEISTIQQRWDDLQQQLKSFDSTLERERDRISSALQEATADLQKDVEVLQKRWSTAKEKATAMASSDMKQASAFASSMTEFSTDAQTLRQRATANIEHCQGCGVQPPTFTDLDQLEADIGAQQQSWSLYSAWQDELNPLQTQRWVEFQHHLNKLDNLCLKWQQQLKTQQQNNNNNNLILATISTDIRKFRELYPLLQRLTNADDWESQHWNELSTLGRLPTVNGELLNNRTLLLQHLLEARDTLLSKECKTQIIEFCTRVQGELDIKRTITQLKQFIATERVSLVEFRTTQSQDPARCVVWLIREFKDCIDHCSDEIAICSSLRSSRYFTSAHKAVVGQYEDEFRHVIEALQYIAQIQRKWTYLEPIIMRGALPQQTEVFKRIDGEFRDMISICSSGLGDAEGESGGNDKRVTKSGVARTIDGHDLMRLAQLDLKHLQTLTEQLDRSQRALSAYLEAKRQLFPRFYFIGDDDLLEILGQATDVQVINRHIRKLFTGVHELQISTDGKSIVALRSSAGEEVKLYQPIQIAQQVELYLAALVDVMVETLKRQTVSVIHLLQKQAEVNYDNYASQVLCLAAQVVFTQRTEVAIAGQQLSQLLQQSEHELSTLTNLTTNNTLLALKIKALVMDLIHHIDVLKQLIRDKITTVDAWSWQKQLRLYLDQPTQTVVVRMVDAEFQYSYEYAGNVEKLVHTPLSDKCYLVLTSAMHLGYGGCPQGPAGTGAVQLLS